MDDLRSMFIGTLGLQIVLLLAAVLSFTRPIMLARAGAIARPALFTLALQALHFCEEYLTGFYREFPQRLGLSPWSDAFFVAFNMTWIAVWAISLAFLPSWPRLAGVFIWFLALAAMANGIAHPLLALAAGGYFPGLFTVPVLGLCGLWLAFRLSAAARKEKTA